MRLNYAQTAKVGGIVSATVVARGLCSTKLKSAGGRLTGAHFPSMLHAGSDRTKTGNTWK